MIRSALARRQLSIMTSSCMMFSLTGGQVGWIRNTSRPRTSSLILQEISPSGNVPRAISPERHAEVLGNATGQGRVGGAAENFEIVHGEIMRK